MSSSSPGPTDSPAPPKPAVRPDDDALRKAMRSAAIERRNLQNSDRIAAWSAALCERLHALWPQPPGRIIGFCWPVRNEPDLRPQLRRWIGQGATAVLPVVVAPDAPLLFRPWLPDAGGGAMVADRFGIPTPVDGPERVPDALLLPLNAFDLAGYRIGYGGGFFDRTLAELDAQGRRPLSIGVGFDLGLVDTTRPQPHDQRLDWVVTETQAFRCS